MYSNQPTRPTNNTFSQPRMTWMPTTVHSLKKVPGFMAKRLPVRLLPLAILFAAALLLSGCASDRQWYKTGQTQADFDREEQDCLRVAEEMSRQGTITGRSNLELFVKAYNTCLFSKGWTNLPPENRTTASDSPEKNGPSKLVALTGDTQMTAFGRTLNLPETFTLRDRNFSSMGPTRMETLLWEGKEGVFVSCIAQKGDLGIEKTRYPVPSPLKVYDRGILPKDNPSGTRWTSFFGTLGTDRIGGLGAFIPGARGERIVLTITSPLPDPSKNPAPGLTLDRQQKQFMDDLLDTWRPRLPAPAPQASTTFLNTLLSVLPGIN